MLIFHSSSLSDVWKGTERFSITGHALRYYRYVLFTLPGLCSLGLQVTTVVTGPAVLESVAENSGGISVSLVRVWGSEAEDSL